MLLLQGRQRIGFSSFFAERGGSGPRPAPAGRGVREIPGLVSKAPRVVRR